jgi:hypothetical protein
MEWRKTREDQHFVAKDNLTNEKNAMIVLLSVDRVSQMIEDDDVNEL